MLHVCGPSISLVFFPILHLLNFVWVCIFLGSGLIIALFLAGHFLITYVHELSTRFYILHTPSILCGWRVRSSSNGNFSDIQSQYQLSSEV